MLTTSPMLQAAAIGSAGKFGGDSAKATAVALAQAFSQGANAQSFALAKASCFQFYSAVLSHGLGCFLCITETF